MEQKQWLDHTVYRVYRNDASYWEAAILQPKSTTMSIFPGDDTGTLTAQSVRERYGENAERLTEATFQREMNRRLTHTPEMLTLLKENWTGDLSTWHVYGSILRPMSGISIPGTVYLNGGGARYEHYEIHTYVVSPEPLDERTIEHYTLVTISHPDESLLQTALQQLHDAQELHDRLVEDTIKVQDALRDQERQ